MASWSRKTKFSITQRNIDMATVTYNFLHFANLKDIPNWSVQYADEEDLGFTKKFPMARIGSFLVKSRDIIEVQDDVEYKQVTLKINNGGVVPRNNGATLKGSKIGTKRQYVIHAGQFIMSKIDARNGAYGIVPAELEGAIVTNDFPVFDVDIEKVIPQFLVLVSTTDKFVEFARKCSSGTTNRKRIDIAAFLNQQIPLPRIEEQKKILEVYNAQANQVSKLETDIRDVWDSIVPYIKSALYISSKDRQIQSNNEKYKMFGFVHLNTIDRWDIWNINDRSLIPRFPEIRLSGLIRLQSGKFLSKKDFLDGDYPVYGGNGITGYHNDFCYQGKRLVIGRVGEYCGNVHLIDGNYWVTDNALKVDLISDKVSLEYMELALLALELGRYRIVSAQPSISQSTILSLSIPVPNKVDQDQLITQVDKMRSIVSQKNKYANQLIIKAKEQFYKTIFE